VIWREIGFLAYFCAGDVSFWAKNGGWEVGLQGLGKIGREKALKNVRKRLKIFENIRKRSKKLQKSTQKCAF